MVLGRSGNNAGVLAAVEVTGIVAGLVMTAWGGPRRRVPGVLSGCLLTLIGITVSGIGQSLPTWGAGVAFVSLGMVLFGSSSQAIW